MLMKKTEKHFIDKLYNCLPTKSQRMYQSTPGPKNRFSNATGYQNNIGSQLWSYDPTLSSHRYQSQGSHCEREKLQTGEVVDARMNCVMLSETQKYQHKPPVIQYVYS